MHKIISRILVTSFISCLIMNPVMSSLTTSSKFFPRPCCPSFNEQALSPRDLFELQAPKMEASQTDQELRKASGLDRLTYEEFVEATNSAMTLKQGFSGIRS